MTLTAQQYAALASDVYDEPRETGENSRTVDIGGAHTSGSNTLIVLLAIKA